MNIAFCPPPPPYCPLGLHRPPPPQLCPPTPLWVLVGRGAGGVASLDASRSLPDRAPPPSFPLGPARACASRTRPSLLRLRPLGPSALAGLSRRASLVRARAHTHTHAHAQAHTHAHAGAHTHAHTPAHTHARVRTHTLARTHSRPFSSPFLFLSSSHPCSPSSLFSPFSPAAFSLSHSFSPPFLSSSFPYSHCAPFSPFSPAASSFPPPSPPPVPPPIHPAHPTHSVHSIHPIFSLCSVADDLFVELENIRVSWGLPHYGSSAAANGRSWEATLHFSHGRFDTGVATFTLPTVGSSTQEGAICASMAAGVVGQRRTGANTSKCTAAKKLGRWGGGSYLLAHSRSLYPPSPPFSCFVNFVLLCAPPLSSSNPPPPRRLLAAYPPSARLPERDPGLYFQW